MSNRKPVSSRIACPTFIDEKAGPAGSSRRLTFVEFREAWAWLEWRIVRPTVTRFVTRGTNYLEEPARRATEMREDRDIASIALVRARLWEEFEDLVVDVLLKFEKIAKSPAGLPASRAALVSLANKVVNSTMRSRTKDLCTLTFAAGNEDAAPKRGAGCMPLQVASPDVIAECRDILRKAEEIVGPEKFGILTDFFVLDMSQAEIAAKHGKTELSIKLKIFRALEEIARSLGISRNQAKT